MNRRMIFAAIASALFTVKARAAQTLIRGSQLFAPAINGTMVRLLRSPGTEVYAELGPTLKTLTQQNPARVQLDVDWTTAPPVPTPPRGLTIAPKLLTLTDGNRYVNNEPIPANHLLFCNGTVFFPGDDYTFNGNTIVALHPAMLEADAKVVIAY